jgi:hypothetical protein
MTMKLYVWNDPYLVSYGSTLLIVVARDVESARRLACDKARAKSWHFGDLEHKAMVFDESHLGEPTRVVDLPCAEWHYWSE